MSPGTTMVLLALAAGAAGGLVLGLLVAGLNRTSAWEEGYVEGRQLARDAVMSVATEMHDAMNGLSGGDGDEAAILADRMTAALDVLDSRTRITVRGAPCP